MTAQGRRGADERVQRRFGEGLQCVRGFQEILEFDEAHEGRARKPGAFRSGRGGCGPELPRLSPATSVVELIFDTLYMEDIIQEGYFRMWQDDADDERPGKIETMLSVSI